MRNISITQVILMVVAGFAIVIGVFFFAFYRGGSSNSELAQVTIWGTVPQEMFTEIRKKIREGSNPEILDHVIYIEKTSETFEEELVTELAEGRGPDLVILSEGQIISNEGRIIKIPYESIDLRSFNDTFIEESKLLTTNDGLIGLPFMIDPLVLYYNKDILNSAGIARVPTTWSEILAITPDITVKDSSLNISKSTIALGDFENINNAKEIILTLIMQAGNNIIIRDETLQEEGRKPYFSVLNERLNFSLPPAYAAINFYSQFANPGKTIYSWNRSLPSSQDFFLAGDSAFYIGFASELGDLKRKNPNLNFDVALLPQSKDATKKTTYGKMHSVSIVRSTKNIESAFQTVTILSGKRVQEILSEISDLPSPRRDLLSTSDPTSSFDLTFRRSALISSGVLEPNQNAMNTIIKRMIESIVSGQYDVDEAINRADTQIKQQLLN